MKTSVLFALFTSMFFVQSVQAQTTFSPRTDLPVGTYPQSVAVGDLNGDGKPDMVVANSNSNTVSVLLNTTAPGAKAPVFTSKTDFTAGPYPYSVAIVDLNGDGKPDLVTANYTSNTVSVLLNTTAPGATTPVFTEKTDFTTGSYPSSISVGDLNGDGKPDLAVVNSNSGTVSVLLNTTAPGTSVPTFAAKTDLTAGYRPISAAIGDVNGDGKPDLAVANYFSNTVSVLLNTTSPGSEVPAFTSNTDFNLGSHPMSVSTSDFNGDGKPDLVLAYASSNIVSVLLNTTAPGASTPVFTANTDFNLGTGPQSVSIGDINCDGKLDLAITNAGSNTVSVLLNTTSPGASIPDFTRTDFTTGTGPQSVAINDINGDGKPDLAVANSSSGTVSVILNTTALGNSTPGFTRTDFPTGTFLTSVAISDLNGDGKPDLAVTNVSSNSNTVSVFLNITPLGSSTPVYSAKTDFPTGTYPKSVAISDLNGDGKPDMAVANDNSKTVSVFLNKTAPGASIPVFARTDFNIGGYPNSIKIGDFNGDGKPDLAIASSRASVLLNTTASGALTPNFTRTDFDIGANPYSITIGDFNGDGKPDLAVANQTSNTVSVLLNATAPGALTPVFAAKTDFSTGTYPRSVAIGDLNGDGKPDLAVTNYGSYTVSVLFNKTAPGALTPVFAEKTDCTAGFFPESIAIGDLNGDGRPDLAVTSGFDYTVSVLFNKTAPGATTPAFTEKTDISTGVWPTSIAIGDLNGDGRPDLAVANFNPNTISVLLNSPSLGMPSDVSHPGQPWTTELQQNYPNPFNPSTSIRFTLEKESEVNIRVYDITGREVRELINNEMTKGSHVVYWDGTNAQRHRVSSGIYLYQLMVNGQVVSSRKMNLLK